MVIDTSALLAVLFMEPEAVEFREEIAVADKCYLSAVSLVEASIVIARRFGQDSRDLDTLIREAEIEVLPFTVEQAEIARTAYARYGKGRHPAKLNFGDCCVYAAAVALGEPLLFKGEDFGQTDVEVA